MVVMLTIIRGHTKNAFGCVERGVIEVRDTWYVHITPVALCVGVLPGEVKVFTSVATRRTSKESTRFRKVLSFQLSFTSWHYSSLGSCERLESEGLPAGTGGLIVSRISVLVRVTLTVTQSPETVIAADSGCLPTL